MRIDNDLRRCVVFLGFKDDSPGMGGIWCVGTGFLFFYKNAAYLATVKHVAKELNESPFVVRVNRPNGVAINIETDQVKWYYHNDDNVDIAITECTLITNMFDAIYLEESVISGIEENNIGIGDNCYTIGLFRLMFGKMRNLPIVHTGNIAMVPGDEKIPVEDWDNPPKSKPKYIEGYLIESQSLNGLSGAPVFARPTIDCPIGRKDNEGILGSLLAIKNIFLIGIWQGAWNAPPDKILAAEIERGKMVRVSLGMGVVVPITKLIELLEMPELQKRRDQINAEHDAKVHAAELDSVRVPSQMDNPQHKEDFNSLVTAATKKKKQDD